MRRIDFEANCWNVDPDEFLSLAEPLYAGHRLQPYLESMSWQAPRRAAAREKLRHLNPDGIELTAYEVVFAVPEEDQELRGHLQNAVLNHMDWTARDLSLILSRARIKRPQRQARKLLEVSPHAPAPRRPSSSMTGPSWPTGPRPGKKTRSSSPAC